MPDPPALPRRPRPVHHLTPGSTQPQQIPSGHSTTKACLTMTTLMAATHCGTPDGHRTVAARSRRPAPSPRARGRGDAVVRGGVVLPSRGSGARSRFAAADRAPGTTSCLQPGRDVTLPKHGHGRCRSFSAQFIERDFPPRRRQHRRFRRLERYAGSGNIDIRPFRIVLPPRGPRNSRSLSCTFVVRGSSRARPRSATRRARTAGYATTNSDDGRCVPGAHHRTGSRRPGRPSRARGHAR